MTNKRRKFGFVVYLTSKFLIIGCSGLISNTLLLLMNSKLEGSPIVCAFINLQQIWLHTAPYYLNVQNISSKISRKKEDLPFHVCRPTKFSWRQNTRWRAESVRNLHTCHFISQTIFNPVTCLAEFLLHLLFLFLILITCRSNKLT